MNTSQIGAPNIDGISFELFDVEPASVPSQTVSTRNAVETLINGPVESCSHLLSKCLKGVSTNPLLTAAAICHAEHRPLALSPDAIWLTILQGFSIHLEENWEEWKSQVVSTSLEHRVVNVSTEEFPIGSPESPWDELIVEATSNAYGAVQENVADLFNASFSITTKHDRAAMDIAFLAAVNNHISLYDIISVCGIPSIELKGNLDDWRKIRSLVDRLDAFGLSWWTKKLKPICDEFVHAFETAPNVEFWKKLYTIGDPICKALDRVTGWIGYLFPFTISIREGARISSQFTGGEPPSLETFPIGLREISMRSQRNSIVKLMGGFLGITQSDNGLTLRPLAGWAIRRQSRMEELLDRCEQVYFTNAYRRKESGRIDIVPECKKLEFFYDRFESLSINVLGEPKCKFLSPEEQYGEREKPKINVIAELADDRWIGTVALHTVDRLVAYLKDKRPHETVYIVGDKGTKIAKGVADIITTDFATLLTRILDCAEQNEELTFDVKARVDPKELDLLDELFPM